MLIELEDDTGDTTTINTDAASREELVEGLIGLKKAYDQIDRNWDKRAEAMKENGLDFSDFGGPEASVDMVDPDKAFAGFRRMLTEFEEEQANKSRRQRLKALEDDDDDDDEESDLERAQRQIDEMKSWLGRVFS